MYFGVLGVGIWAFRGCRELRVSGVSNIFGAGIWVWGSGVMLSSWSLGFRALRFWTWLFKVGFGPCPSCSDIVGI